VELWCRGRSYSEIAAELGKSPGYIRTLISSLRKRYSEAVVPFRREKAARPASGAAGRRRAPSLFSRYIFRKYKIAHRSPVCLTHPRRGASPSSLGAGIPWLHHPRRGAGIPWLHHPRRGAGIPWRDAVNEMASTGPEKIAAARSCGNASPRSSGARMPRTGRGIPTIVRRDDLLRPHGTFAVIAFSAPNASPQRIGRRTGPMFAPCRHSRYNARNDAPHSLRGVLSRSYPVAPV
jgi:hypothetical protein